MSHSQRPARVARIARVATLACLGIFALAMGAACVSYPGGSWTLRDAQGFSPLRNFWCDLLRSHAINGADNSVGKALASMAFAALGAGLWPFWWVAASLLGPRARAIVWRCGAASAAALVAMALVPSDRYPLAHGVVALGGGLLGVVAAALCVGERSPGEPALSLRRCSGGLALVLALVHAAFYVHVAYLHAPENVLHPATQKLATAALVVWMLASVASARARAGILHAERRAHTSAV